jgi:hypothetical protein
MLILLLSYGLATITTAGNEPSLMASIYGRIVIGKDRARVSFSPEDSSAKGFWR